MRRLEVRLVFMSFWEKEREREKIGVSKFDRYNNKRETKRTS